MTIFPPAGRRWVVAHRGVSAHAPENTAAAFDRAVADEADAIECDLRLSADGRVVVCHDADFTKFGRPDLRVAETSLAELQKVDVGAWFAPDFAGERLLGLGELLDRVAGRVPLYLELKTDSREPEREPLGDRLERFAETVAAECRSRKMLDRVAFLAFDPAAIGALHAAGCVDGLVFNVHEPDFLTGEQLQALPQLAAVDCNIKRLTSETAELIRGHGLRLLAYTCDGETDVLKAANLGVAAIITNDPRQTREILRRHDRNADATRS